MYRLKIKPEDVGRVLDVISSVDGVVGLEIYLLINDQKTLIDVIQKCISLGVPIEIIPAVSEKPRESEKAVKPAAESVHPSAVSTKIGAAVAEATGTSPSTVRKRKSAPEEMQGEKPEKERSTGGADKGAPQDKQVKTKNEENEKKEAERAATSEIRAEGAKQQGAKEEQQREKTDLTKMISEQLQEAENELDFDELLKLRDEAFSRTLIE